MIKEQFYTCPYCFAEVSVLVDLSAGEQEYIEDCERCCNPIQFRVSLDEDLNIESFSADPIGQ